MSLRIDQLPVGSPFPTWIVQAEDPSSNVFYQVPFSTFSGNTQRIYFQPALYSPGFTTAPTTLFSGGFGTLTIPASFFALNAGAELLLKVALQYDTGTAPPPSGAFTLLAFLNGATATPLFSSAISFAQLMDLDTFTVRVLSTGATAATPTVDVLTDWPSNVSPIVQFNPGVILGAPTGGNYTFDLQFACTGATVDLSIYDVTVDLINTSLGSP